MIIFPAIDLQNGQCVRLLKGDFNSSTIYNSNPVDQALEFERLGFKFLHLVNLDATIDNSSPQACKNYQAISQILQNVKIPVQIGGGIKNEHDVEKWLKLGVKRVIIGSMAVKNYHLAAKICQDFPEQVIIGIDSKNEKVAINGWLENSATTPINLAKKFDQLATKPIAIIYTNINNDGTLSGFDYDGTKNLAQAVSIKVIASGGIGNVDHLFKVCELEKCGVVGVVLGKAWYEKKISIAEVQNFL